MAQQELQPAEETPEVIADCGEDNVDGITLTVPEIIAAYAMFGLEMTNHRLNRRASVQLALDLWSYRRFRPEVNTLNL